jgi:RNA polymerase sigma-32 factor
MRGAEEAGFQAYVRSLRRWTPLDRETELELAQRWAEKRDPKAAHALVEANLLFVVKVANSFRRYGMPIADLVAEGNLGLLQAVQRFDASRDVRFVTYAAYWIRAYVLAYVVRHWSVVRFGSAARQTRLFFGLQRTRARLQSALGHTADPGEIDELLAKRFATTPEQIREMTGRLGDRDVSLDAPAYRTGSAAQVTQLFDDSDSQEDDLGQRQREQRVREELGRIDGKLNDRERYILQHRLLAEEPQTLFELGQSMRLSRERVRQLEERLKRKLRVVLSDLAPQAEAA